MNIVEAAEILRKNRHQGYALWVVATDLKDGKPCVRGSLRENIVLSEKEAIKEARRYEG